MGRRLPHLPVGRGDSVSKCPPNSARAPTTFITLLGGSAVTWPSAVAALERSKVKALLMFKEWDRALERLANRVGVINVAHPSSTDIPHLLKRLVPLPIRGKQLKRQKKPLFTTLLRRFHIVLVYRFLQFQKRE
jgi:hypothetical protein